MGLVRDCPVPPHPGPLPWGEGVAIGTSLGCEGMRLCLPRLPTRANHQQRWNAIRDRTADTRRMILPLPEGEGRGEGEGTAHACKLVQMSKSAFTNGRSARCSMFYPSSEF